MPALYPKLQSLLTDTPLLWLSESGYPIEAVRLPFWAIWGWRKETEDGYDALVVQVNRDSGIVPCPCEEQEWLFYIDCPNNCKKKAWQKIERLLDQPTICAYRRPNGKPSEYTLLILVREGLGYSGIKTTLVES